MSNDMNATMMSKEQLEYRSFVNLDQYNDMEIILLKGHLILEQHLNCFIVSHKVNADHLNKVNLTYSKTLEMARAMEFGHFIEEHYKCLKEINRIRNKIAHEISFEEKGYSADLKKWASHVLGYKPKTLDTNKKTYKNHVIKAFAFLSGQIHGFSKVIDSVHQHQIQKRKISRSESVSHS